MASQLPSTGSGTFAEGSGTCPVCRRAGIKVIKSSGLLRRHGPHDNPCTGHNLSPVTGSFVPAASGSTTTQASQASANDTSADLFDTSSAPTPSVGHPTRGAPILKRLPKGVRPSASTVLQHLIQTVVRDPQTSDHWGRLFSFAPACFVRPGRGGKSRNLTSLVKRQIEAFDSGASGFDTPRASDIPVRKHAATRKGVSEAEQVARRASVKLEEGDVKGAIRLLSSRDTLAPATQATLTSLRSLHPPVPLDRRPAPTTLTAPLQATPQAVLAAITSFPHGSAGGPDGLRPQHLKDLLDGVRGNVGTVSGEGGTSGSGPGPTANPLLEAITDLVNLLLSGEVPQFVRASLFGGSITALAKKGGGVRPIAVGYTWRRLAGKVACRLVSARAAALLAPRQLGFGVTGGTEAAVHACRRYVENMPQGHVFVKIDFTNAFNTLRRDVILEAVERHLPELLPYASYSENSDLQFGDFSLQSQEGAQQGDPLGPLYFCLAVHDLLSSLQSPIVVGYLDDMSMGGEAGKVAEDFTRLESGAAKLGLTLNRSKCEVAGLTDATRSILAARGVAVKEVEMEDLVLLGSPLLPGVGVDTVLASKREDLETLASRLPLMPAHDCLFLLRNVVTTPRLVYTLRTAPCTGSKELVLYDEVLRSTLSTTLNVDLSDGGWQQASLPVRWGGLGVRSAVMLAPSAYLASAASTATLVQKLLPPFLHHITDRSTPNALAAWKSAVEPSTLPPVDVAATRQRSWDDPCCQRSSTLLLNSAVDDTDKARLRASLTATSGAWLQALPISSVGLRMDDDVIRVAVGLRLGSNLCEPHTCTCGVPVDARGTHGLACKRSAGRHPRHGLLNDVVWRAMLRAQVPSCKEPAGLSRSDGKRPDGVSLIPWSRGRCVTWDV